MKGAITPHTDNLLNLLDRALKDEDYEVLSNAAFATGLLIEHSTIDISQHLGHILQTLHPLFIIPPDPTTARQNAKDNAAGAVGRIIIRYAAFIPLEQVLPIFLGALPLKDHLENRPVFRALFQLFETNGALLYPYLDQLLPVFAYVLDPTGKDQLGDEIRAQLVRLIALINQEASAKVQAAGLSPYLVGL
jgi:HEAT repeat protein